MAVVWPSSKRVLGLLRTVVGALVAHARAPRSSLCTLSISVQRAECVHACYTIIHTIDASEV
jgi:hypothetical protein